MPGFIFPNGRLTSCCFCIKLSIGCRIIGSLTALICCLEFLTTINKFMELLERKRKCQENLHWESELDHLFYVDCSHITVVRFILVTEFIAFLMGFVSSLLLLYGIRNKQPKLFIAWQIFIGTVIFSNFFTILFWRDVSMIFEKILLVLILSYFFKVVKSYHAKLTEEIANGYPVVAVTFPEESNMSLFLSRPNISNEIKDDPPPPYPGPPIIHQSVSIEMQPPPYSVAVNPNSVELSLSDAPSSSTAGGVTDMSSHRQGILEIHTTTECSYNIPNDPASPSSEFNSSNSESISLPSLETISETPSKLVLVPVTIPPKTQANTHDISTCQSDQAGIVDEPPTAASQSCSSSPILQDEGSVPCQASSCSNQDN